jgi:hypothetical protein
MENKSTIMHEFKDGGSMNPFSLKFIISLLVVIVLGFGSGYLLAKVNPNLTQPKALPSPDEKNAIEAGKTYGTNDTGTFKDSAEGILKEGGIEGEGQYHLERPGGESQNVYMTSSLVDLSLFINRKVKVWGATQTAQRAGWLMDVGKVEVLD